MWQCFGEIFRQPLQFSSIGQVLRIWMPKLGRLSQFDFIKAGIAAFAFWELWVFRWDATYDGRQMNGKRICMKVIARVQLLSLTFNPSKPSTNLQIHIMGIIGLQPKLIREKRGTWCRWERPLLSCKLNIDGSARGDDITGGGVLRNTMGRVIASFSHYFGQGTITMAEFLAL